MSGADHPPETRVPGTGEIAPDAIRAALEQVLASTEFRASRRCQEFLRFVVDTTLAGNAQMLKERTIGVEVFGRAAAYDPGNDSTVRVKAGGAQAPPHVLHRSRRRQSGAHRFARRRLRPGVPPRAGSAAGSGRGRSARCAGRPRLAVAGCGPVCAPGHRIGRHLPLGARAGKDRPDAAPVLGAGSRFQQCGVVLRLLCPGLRSRPSRREWRTGPAPG